MIDNSITSIMNTGTSYRNQGASGELGKDDFLNLMLQQLKYQDPMEPLDSSEYTAQLAQFSELEQMQNMNDNLTSSITANFQLAQSVNNTMAASLIGKEVKLDGKTIYYTDTDQASQKLGYTLPEEVVSTKIEVYDSKGNLVRTIDDLPEQKGDHKLSWDFTDDNGENVPAGNYTFKVVAKASNGEELSINSFKIGTIDAVRYTENGTVLMVNGNQYSLSDIFEIMNPVTDNS